MNDENCIFCKIVRGDIPSDKILETENVLVFMDHSALSEGHCLFIPKIHAERAHDVADDALNEIMTQIKRVVLAMGIQDYNILQNNGKIAHQAVFHAHWHLIPKRQDEGLNIIWKPIEGLDQTQIADKIRRKLK